MTVEAFLPTNSKMAFAKQRSGMSFDKLIRQNGLRSINKRLNAG